MAISSRRQLLRLSQTGLQFTAVSGGPDVPVQNVQVLNSGLGVMGWNIGVSTLSGGSWLGVNPLEGASAPSDPATVDVRVNPRGLAPGPYYGLAEVAAPVAANSHQLATVVLSVLPPGGAPGPIIRPLGLFVGAEPGGAAPPAQAVDIFNVTSQPMQFVLQAVTLNGIGWLGPAMAEGTAAPGGPTAIGVEVDASELGTGIHRGLLRLVFDGTLTRTVQVVLAVAPGAAAALKPPEGISQDRIFQEECGRTEMAPVFKVLGSTTPIAAGWPASIEVEVADNCATKMTEGSVVVEFANIASTSLALVHTGSGLWAETWNVPSSAGPDSMGVATVTATDFAGIKGAVSQALAVNPNPSAPPQIAPGGVVHSASFVLDPLAPGTIVSIFGSNLSSEPVSGGGALGKRHPTVNRTGRDAIDPRRTPSADLVLPRRPGQRRSSVRGGGSPERELTAAGSPHGRRQSVRVGAGTGQRGKTGSIHAKWLRQRAGLDSKCEFPDRDAGEPGQSRRCDYHLQRGVGRGISRRDQRGPGAWLAAGADGGGRDGDHWWPLGGGVLRRLESGLCQFVSGQRLHAGGGACRGSRSRGFDRGTSQPRGDIGRGVRQGVYHESSHLFRISIKSHPVHGLLS